MKPVPPGFPSKSIFLTAPVVSFLGSAAASAEDPEAARPKPETRVAKRPANALRVKRLESICDSPFRFNCSSETPRQYQRRKRGCPRQHCRYCGPKWCSSSATHELIEQS